MVSDDCSLRKLFYIIYMIRPIEVKPLSGYKLWLKYNDGVSGEVDLSYLVGKGVFSVWKDYDIFESVRLGKKGELIWDKNLDLCPDSLYLKLTGKSPENIFSSLTKRAIDA